MANTVQKESKVVYLQIGQNYEHLAENKQFDVSEWVAEFPEATIYMLFKRPGEAAVAPVQTTLEDGILTWTISNWETGIIGIGFAEIRAIDSSTGMVKKSHVIPCSIEASVTDEDTAPDYPSWVDRMITMNEHLESVYSDFSQELEDGIEAIQGEAGTQKDAIQDKGAEVIASIPASYQTVLESIAPQYASGRPWPKDWFCWYNNKLYQHREDETVAGEFDPDKWYQVVFADVASEATISAKDTRTALYDIAAPEYVTWRSYHTDDYDPAEAFPAIAVGDYYIYDLQMYRCIVPIPVGGDTETWAEGTRIARKFVPEHWERVAVYTELQKYVQSDVLAPEYSASTTYKAGQYVWYSGNVYRCKTDISTAEAWTAAHWQLVKIGDELTSLKSAFDGIVSDSVSENVSWEIGTANNAQDWADGSGSSNSNTDITKFVDISKFKLIRYMAFCSTASTTKAGIAFFGSKSVASYISGVKAYEGSAERTMREQWAFVPSGANFARFTVLHNFDSFFITGYKTVIDETADQINKYHEPNVEYKPVLWTIGTISSGTPASSTTRVRSTTIFAKKGDLIKCDSDVKFNPIYYTAYDTQSNANYLKNGKASGPDNTDYVVDTDGWIRIIVGDINDVAITDADAIGNKVHYYKKDDYIVDMTGKTVAIIGASIDTHGNSGIQFPNAVEIKITSEDVGVQLSAYLTAHDVASGLSLGGHTFTDAEIGTEVTFTPTVSDVGKVIGLPADYNGQSMNVWWCAAMPFFGYTPIPVCWSGSSISSHEKNTSTRKCSWAWHPSQIRKCGIRIPGTMNRIAPDYIIITRIVNDYSHAPYDVLDFDYFDIVPFTYPQDDVDTNGVYHYMWAYVMTIKALREAYPRAIIILQNGTPVRRVSGYVGDIPNNGVNTIEQFNDAISKIGAYMNCPVLDNSSCGITLENMAETTKDNDTHPNQIGQYLKANKFIAEFTKIVNGRY